ncbi:Nse4-domain-containing protein [Dothidotthia symphoricarpi CBS 119687]|uniref:Non-structural maintenance of chromosomes element 4 n=1 Tax=Dothidotthia symphoricarpi CBS 119687 TaxID=1392245 RepID=A0A6A6A381_9PLEO|nr:Nse4-domain-containing protein [Dothidotthia symphoricarpi CBS 119687]KAF2126270.1 Nse4-domain-containing protein [Dothidotthia symphoricarpi CBS 119687]
MARLNTHLSATPQQSRATTADTLYRDPSVAPRNARNARPSTYSVISPSQSMASDKENEMPETRENTPRPSKARGLRGASVRMPTPDSGSTAGGSGNKRRRTGTYSMGGPQVYEDEEEELEEEEDEDEEVDDDDTTGQVENDESEHQKHYDPNQPPEQARRVRAHLRDNHRTLEENRDDMIGNNSHLHDLLLKQNSIFGKVRQTIDAAADSRFLVHASDLATKKLDNSLHGSSGVSIDLDKFVSKCIHFMKTGGNIEDAPVVADDDEEDDTGDGLDWALFGRQACFPFNRRPPTSGFLLGPLSVQKRVRTTQRKARSQRQPLAPETRPQEIREADLQESENSNLSHLVKGIKSHLERHIERAQEGVEQELSQIGEDDVGEEDQRAACRRFRVDPAPTGELAVGLLDFAINPRDFGQTVENLFYISFLVREGNAMIMKDDDGLPLLMPGVPHGVSEQREKNVQKNQAVFSINYANWQMFIDAFDIKEPLIPHRENEDVNAGPSGWYG